MPKKLLRQQGPADRAAAHEGARELDPAFPSSSFEDQRERSRAAAKAKRAKKEALRQKKRAANEAQQLDTPFYVAVAQGGPKARFRPPVPMVPSRITERLSSAVSEGAGGGGGGGGGRGTAAANTRLKFGALVLDSPASDCLLAAGITEPTGIQKAGMGPILDGESVILHAMTGSGKTLTFLLPLMQRWTPGLFSPTAGARGGLNGGERGVRGAGDGAGGAGGGDAPWQVMLALPTRELAVQVAREVVLLSGGLTSSVELLVDAGVFQDLSKVTAPIVVGSAKVLERCVLIVRSSGSVSLLMCTEYVRSAATAGKDWFVVRTYTACCRRRPQRMHDSRFGCLCYVLVRVVRFRCVQGLLTGLDGGADFSSHCAVVYGCFEKNTVGHACVCAA